MKLSLNQAKSILTPSKLPGADYVVNPYSGCAFGCVYCYAEFTRKFTDHMDDEWGKYVDVKINTTEVFEKEIANLTKKVIKKNEFKKDEYKKKLSNTIFNIVKENNLELVGGKVIDHIKLRR